MLTPLHSAAAEGHRPRDRSPVSSDLFSPPTPTPLDASSNTPLHALVLRPHRKHAMRHLDCYTASAASLVKFGVLFNERNDCGHTAIGLAASNGYPRIVQLLLAEGAELGSEWAHLRTDDVPTGAGWNPNGRVSMEEESEEGEDFVEEERQLVDVPVMGTVHVADRRGSSSKHVSFATEIKEIPVAPDSGFPRSVESFEDSVLDSSNPFNKGNDSISNEYNSANNNSGSFFPSGHFSIRLASPPPPHAGVSPTPPVMVSPPEASLKLMKDESTQFALEEEMVDEACGMETRDKKGEGGLKTRLFLWSHTNRMETFAKSSPSRKTESINKSTQLELSMNSTSAKKGESVSPVSKNFPKTTYNRLDNRKARADFFSTRTLQDFPPDSSRDYLPENGTSSFRGQRTRRVESGGGSLPRSKEAAIQSDLAAATSWEEEKRRLRASLQPGFSAMEHLEMKRRGNQSGTNSPH